MTFKMCWIVCAEKVIASLPMELYLLGNCFPGLTLSDRIKRYIDVENKYYHIRALDEVRVERDVFVMKIDIWK